MLIVLRVLYWIVTIPYTLIIAFFAIGTPYCAVGRLGQYALAC
jgi:hypothetical protein